MTPERAASHIAAIVHSWRYSHDAWGALTEEERDQVMADWAAIIRRDRGQAVDAILADILARPGLGPAWRQLSEFSPSSARPAVFADIVARVEPGAV